MHHHQLQFQLQIYVLDWLKPQKSVKVYRGDDTGISGLSYAVWRDSLKFADDNSRRRRWDEISLSQGYGKIQSGDSPTNLPSEYGLLANNSAVTFATGAALFEFTLPLTEADYHTVAFDVTAGTSANYDVMALRYWNTADDTATFRTYNLAMPQLVTWDTLETFSSSTALSVTIPALDRYMNGNKISIGVFRTNKNHRIGDLTRPCVVGLQIDDIAFQQIAGGYKFGGEFTGHRIYPSVPVLFSVSNEGSF